MSDSILIAIGYLGLGFGFGVIAGGVATFLSCRRFLDNLIKSNAKERVEVVDKNGKEVEDTVKTRLLEAAEITKSQNEIMAAVSMPSASAAHSKHKNVLSGQWKQLEERKIAVLQSIVRDGHDPIVTVYNGALKAHEEIPLSKFLNVAIGSANKAPVPPQPQVVPTEEQAGIRKVEKNGKTFFVIDGGKGRKDN